MLKKLTLLTFISLLLLSGCSSIQPKEEVSFASWGSITEVKILKNIIKDFEQENPEIKINFIHIPQNYFQKVHLLFASNTPPDVIFINNLYLPLYSKHLLDLSDLEVKSEFYPQAIESLSYDGKLLAIPRDISNLVFYVNTDLTELPQNDWTIQDLLQLSILATKENSWGISFEEDVFWAQPYLAYFGEKFTEDFDASTSNGFNFYKNLREKYKVAPTKSQIGSLTNAQMFLNGKIAFYLSGRWIYPKIKEQATFNWSIVPFPSGKFPLPCDASGWAVSRESKHKESAIKFIRFLSDNKSIEYFSDTGLIVPARIDVSQRLNKKDHNEKVFLEIIPNSKNTYVTKNYKKILDKVNSKF